MSPPTTYAAWLPALDRFRAGDDQVLDALARGELELSGGVSERWLTHVNDCVTARLTALSERMQGALDRARDALGVSNALIMTRRGLAPVRAFAALPAIPETLRDHLAAELDRWAASAQASLERGAAGIRDDQGRLLKAIRDNPLTAPPPAIPPTPSAPLSGARRRVVL